MPPESGSEITVAHAHNTLSAFPPVDPAPYLSPCHKAGHFRACRRVDKEQM